MNTDSLGCPSCGVSLDERELVFKSQTFESCPKSGSTVRTSDSFSGTNRTPVEEDDDLVNRLITGCPEFVQMLESRKGSPLMTAQEALDRL